MKLLYITNARDVFQRSMSGVFGCHLAVPPATFNDWAWGRSRKLEPVLKVWQKGNRNVCDPHEFFNWAVSNFKAGCFDKWLMTQNVSQPAIELAKKNASFTMTLNKTLAERQPGYYYKAT